MSEGQAHWGEGGGDIRGGGSAKMPERQQRNMVERKERVKILKEML